MKFHQDWISVKALHLLGTLSWISVLSISSSAARKRKQVSAVHMWKWLVHLVMSSEAYTIVAMNFWQVLQLRYGILIFLLQNNFWLTSSFHKIKHKIRRYRIPSLLLWAFPTCMSGFRWIVRSFPQNLLRTSYIYTLHKCFYALEAFLSKVTSCGFTALRSCRLFLSFRVKWYRLPYKVVSIIK